MKTRPLFFAFSISAFVLSCQQKETEFKEEKFDVSFSEPAAVQLADSVIESSGGLEAWSAVRSVSWTNNDLHLSWNKAERLARIESPTDNMVYLLNLNTNEGKVFESGVEITNATTVEEKLKDARKTFHEEAFQRFIPFQLKSQGVMLSYEGEDSLNSEICNVIQAVFNPGSPLYPSKYLVYVDLKENLIRQLTYFTNQSQDSADVTMKLDTYEKHGAVSLPTNPVLEKGPQNIKFDEEFPAKFFSDL